MTRIARIALLTAVMSLSIFAVASAHTVRTDSTVSLKVKNGGQQADTLTGKVTSVKPRCEAQRTIEIYKRVAGPDELAGTTTTDADGNYDFAFPGDFPPGTYYAVATRTVNASTNHRHVCKAAKSEAVDN